MQQLHAGIDRVIKIARTLRDVAGELGKVDLKSQIIDEISILQDLREEFGAATGLVVGNGVASASSDSDTEVISTAAFKLGDNSMAVIQPSGDTETYHIAHALEAEEPTPATATVPPSNASRTEAANAGSNVSDDERAKRAAQAESRIAELEPLHAAAAKRVNDVLTPEQNQIRVKATKAARAAGRTGQDARNYIYAAMKLSDEQKVQLADARKELTAIRAAISKEIEFLLDDEQRQRVASEIHIQLTGNE
ncbi:hypothetical protein GC176_23940 [bacterium]|nr:hypothetical protein [bacterium]